MNTQTSAALAHAFDPRAFRDTLGHYASGITIISSSDAIGPIGFTCQSFYSVSVDPPLVSFSVMTTSTSYPRVRESGSFVVNVLAHDQHSLSTQFARTGTNKWAGVEWQPAPSGHPLIAGNLMWLDCEIWAEHEAGDHLIVIGRVTRIGTASGDGDEPLLYFKGQYRQLRAVTAPASD